MPIKFPFDSPSFFTSLFGKRIPEVLFYYFAAITENVVNEDENKIGNEVQHPKRQQRQQVQKVQTCIREPFIYHYFIRFLTTNIEYMIEKGAVLPMFYLPPVEYFA